ncbi:hypothetical protein [Actinoallomurus iriomotensis]|uniref:Uncharacterized protein n=1 Tax=Actinoallomurus iriomotensis TaxID=478107 RepID=A0A9W6VN67_9ACTN|nr:hypothetical protein [Actinoallomurus iriomotensis]GLY78443.1 hypothetical protein Airi01_067100 [Actinoallomurus iriomotensis]
MSVPKVQRRPGRSDPTVKTSPAANGVSIPAASHRRKLAERLIAGRRMMAGGLLVTLPGVSEVAFYIADRSTASSLLIPVLLTSSSITTAVVLMYRSRQETRRKEIEWHRTNVLADALAACIGDVHLFAADLSCDESLAEAERVRDSARHLVDGSGVALLSQLAAETADEDT